MIRKIFVEFLQEVFAEDHPRFLLFEVLASEVTALSPH